MFMKETKKTRDCIYST